MAEYIEEEVFKNGYAIREGCNTAFLKELDLKVCKIVSDFEPSFKGALLEQLHHHVDKSRVNELRLKIFNTLNERSDFRNDYFSLGDKFIEALCGTELAANTKINFSIQLPFDDTSILPAHCDTFSGESSYQINLWVPLTRSFETNSMFIFKPKATKKVLQDLKKYEVDGLDTIFDEFKMGDDYINLETNNGQVIIFTPTTLHGNRVNQTDITRVSFNCRFKNLHAPYNAPEGSSKVLGQFYSALSEKGATKIGRECSLFTLSE